MTYDDTNTDADEITLSLERVRTELRTTNLIAWHRALTDRIRNYPPDKSVPALRDLIEQRDTLAAEIHQRLDLP